MVRIKVIYEETPDGEIGIDPGLDKKITDFFEGLGFKWTGQGYHVLDLKRDITFMSEEIRLCTPPKSQEVVESVAEVQDLKG